MAFQLSDGTGIPIDVPFTIGTTNYPANWLRLSTPEEKTAAGIVEVADPKSYNSKFYWSDGTAKTLADVNATDKDGNLIKNADGSQHVIYGLKTLLKNEEKQTAGYLLQRYDWLVVRKAEKGTEIPTTIQTFRDQVRTACDSREKEIDACADITALETLFEGENMTQYPNDPNVQVV